MRKIADKRLRQNSISHRLERLETRKVPASLLHSLYPTEAGLVSARFGNIVALEGINRLVGTRDTNTVFLFQGNSTQIVHTFQRPTSTLGGGFGSALAIGNNRIVIGDPNDINATDSGSTWVYDLKSSTPTVPIALKQPNPVANDSFGSSVAISDRYVVVGAPDADLGAADSGAAYVYDLKSATPATAIATLKHPIGGNEINFGITVAVSGSLIIVGATGDDGGAPSAGAVFIFDMSSVNPLIPIATINNPTPVIAEGFGDALDATDQRLVIGASDSSAATGSAYVYDLTNLANTNPLFTLENPTPEANDHFAGAVAISESHVVISAVYDDSNGPVASGAVYIYDLNSLQPTIPVETIHSPTNGPSDFFGQSVGITGTDVLVGSPGASSAFLFDLKSSTPSIPVTQFTKLYPSTYDGLGFAVAIAGKYAISLQQTNGIAYVHDVSSSAPTSPLYLLSNPGAYSNGFPAAMLAASGDVVVIGAPSYGSQLGAAYVYDLSGPNPTQPIVTLVNPTPSSGDFFGVSVAIAGKYVVVGANFDDTLAKDSGAAYVYDLDSPTPSVPIATIKNPTPAASDGFGRSVAVVGKYVAVGSVSDDTGATNSGSAYLYDIESATPTTPLLSFHNPTPAAGDNFGGSLAMSGKYLVIGAYNDDAGASNSGAAYAYDYLSATPTTPITTFINPTPGASDNFSYGLAMSGTKILIGAPNHDGVNGKIGAAYLYDLASATPDVPIDTLNNPSPAANDHFGTAVSISGSLVMVGDDRDDTQELNEGASYVFTIAPAKVAQVVINGGSIQRSRVTKVDISFDQHVVFAGSPTDAFELKRQSDGAVVALLSNVDDTGAGTVVTLNWTGGPIDFGSLADGKYLLTIFANKVSNSNGLLDGNGDGIGGDSQTTTFHRLFGDADGDGRVNAVDWAAFRGAFGSASAVFDFNNDGVVNAVDFAQFRARFGVMV